MFVQQSLPVTSYQACGHLLSPGHRLNRLLSRTACQKVSKGFEIVESVTFLSFLDDSSKEQAKEALDSIWSLQYMIRGPLCGCAGYLDRCIWQQDDAETGFSHAVRFRFKDEPSLDGFWNNQRLENYFSESSVISNAVTLSFHAKVPNELEELFQRGSEWDEGVELMLGVQLKEGHAREDAVEYLELTRQLATSAVYGAVQAIAGPTGGTFRHFGKSKVLCDFILLVRFASNEEASRFLNSPPITAVLQGDKKAPIDTMWSVLLHVSPSENSQTSPQGPGRKL